MCSTRAKCATRTSTGSGLDAEPPSVDALFRLHRAHVERVPYETLWIHIGEHGVSTPDASVGRIATQAPRRLLLPPQRRVQRAAGSLGYDVVRHVGGVHGPDGARRRGPDQPSRPDRRRAPDRRNPDGTWYVDAGLGDALHEPLPLIAGEYEQAPFHLVLDATPGDVGDWHLTHDPQGRLRRHGLASRRPPTHRRVRASATCGCRRHPSRGSCESSPCSGATRPASTSSGA